MNIFSIIISYNPDLKHLSKLCKELKNQGVASIIIDNGSLNKEEISLINYIDTFIPLNNNYGIAKAQNIGIVKAKDLGADYIIFFDQDSFIPKNFISTMINDYNKIFYSQKIGTLGPVHIDSRDGHYYHSVKINKFGFRKKIDTNQKKSYFSTSFIISSGMFISMDTLDEVKYMDEKLFIDYVDTEFCLRLLNHGYSIYITPNIKMSHSIGNGIISLGKLKIPIYKPMRRYYRIRNSIYLTKTRKFPLVLGIREIFINIIYQLILMTTQGHFIGYFKVLVKAVYDGLKMSNKK